MPFGFSSVEDVRRVMAAVEVVEAIKRSPLYDPSIPPMSRTVTWVKVTGSVDAYGMYPAVVVWPDVKKVASAPPDWKEGEVVKAVGINSTEPLVNDTRYEGICVGSHAGRALVIVGLGGGGGTDSHVYAKITGRHTGSAPNLFTYDAKRVNDQTWTDYVPTTNYTNLVYRAPSNVEPPPIDNDQVVRLEPSKTDPSKWVIEAVGSLQSKTANTPPFATGIVFDSGTGVCNGDGSITVTITQHLTFDYGQTITVETRDLRTLTVIPVPPPP